MILLRCKSCNGNLKQKPSQIFECESCGTYTLLEQKVKLPTRGLSILRGINSKTLEKIINNE